MKKFESFTQLEKIPIMEFLQPFIDSQFFIEEELEEDFSKYPNNVISEYIFDEDMFEYFTENDPNFAYRYVENWCERGRGKDEETCHCILERKSDGKNFDIWVHDAGFIGPKTLTLCHYAVEFKK